MKCDLSFEISSSFQHEFGVRGSHDRDATEKKKNQGKNAEFS